MEIPLFQGNPGWCIIWPDTNVNDVYYHTFGCRGEKSGKIVSGCSSGKVVSLCKSDGVLLSNWCNKNIKNTSTIPGRLTWFTWECGPPKKRKIIIQTIMTSGSMLIFGGVYWSVGAVPRRWTSDIHQGFPNWEAGMHQLQPEWRGPVPPPVFGIDGFPGSLWTVLSLMIPWMKMRRTRFDSGEMTMDWGLGHLHSLKLTAIAPENRPGPQKETSTVFHISSQECNMIFFWCWAWRKVICFFVELWLPSFFKKVWEDSFCALTAECYIFLGKPWYIIRIEEDLVLLNIIFCPVWVP